MSVLHATGFTGVAAVLLCAIAYAIRISVDASAGNPYLTLSFLILNAVAWAIGYPLYTRNRDSVLGLTLLVLGDLIFPLNIYAPIFLYAPGLRGNIGASASLVIALGIPHHLVGFLQVKKARFHPVFYPYFFAGSGLALLELSRFTLGVAPSIVGWLGFGYAAIFFVATKWRQCEPAEHFMLAPAIITLGTAAVAAYDLASTRDPSFLFLLFAGSGLLIVHAVLQRDAGPLDRIAGAAAYAALTLAFTGALFILSVAPMIYVIATSLWIVTLMFLGIALPSSTLDPFKDSAHWLAAVLTGGLAIVTWPSWGPLLRLGSAPDSKWLRPAIDLPPLGTAVALALASIALLMLSQWRLRNPSIAMTLAGFVGNLTFLNVTTFAGPLLALIAGGAFVATAFPLANGIAGFGLVIAITSLVVARRLDALYPKAAIDTLGLAAIGIAVVNAWSEPSFLTVALFASSVALLWRSLSGSSIWSFGSFLVLITAAALSLDARATFTALAGLAVLLIVLSGRIVERPDSQRCVRTGLTWACFLGLISVVLELRGDRSVVTFAVVWAGFLVGVRALRPSAGHGDLLRDVVEKLRLVAFLVAHIAGACLLIGISRSLTLDAGSESVALALWALLHYVPLGRGLLGGDRTAAVSTRLAIHGFAIVSMFLATSPEAWILCAFSYSILCFLIATETGEEKADLLEAAYGLALLAVFAGAATSIDTCLLALTGGGAVFLWRSFKDASFLPHLIALGLLGTASGIAAFAFHDAAGVLPIGAFAVCVAALARRHRAEERRDAQVRTSLVVALMAGSCAIVLAFYWTTFAAPILAGLFFGAAPSLAPWLRIRPSEAHPNDTGVTGDEAWVSQCAYCFVFLSSAATLWCALTDLQLILPRVTVMAAWVVAVFIALRVLGAWSFSTPAASAARACVYGGSLLALLLAAIRWRDGFWAVAACIVTVFLALFWFHLEKSSWFEHLAALAVSEGLWIFGASSGVAWADYYLLCVGIYLCLLTVRRPQSAIPMAPASDPMELIQSLFKRDSLLPAATVLLMAGYPIFALIRTFDEMHLAFLTVATILLLNALIHGHAHPAFVVMVCVTFLFGVSFVAVFAEAEPSLWLALVLAGATIIASLRRAEPLDQRLPSGETR